MCDNADGNWAGHVYIWSYETQARTDAQTPKVHADHLLGYRQDLRTHRRPCSSRALHCTEELDCLRF